jgi:hypothetical protein
MLLGSVLAVLLPVAWATIVAFFLAACRAAALADRVRAVEPEPEKTATQASLARARDFSARRGDAFPLCPPAAACAAKPRAPGRGERRWVQLRRI